MLKDIYEYHAEVASKKVAQKIISKIYDTTSKLSDYPKSGQVEETLVQLNEGHRYLLTGNYKIIYKKVPEGILITDVFDTRQDPNKIQT